MAVAARLAATRHTVTVFEQAEAPGGKNAGFSRDGFTFDLGPSALTLPAVYRDLFLKTGRSLEDSVDLQEGDPAFAYHFIDGSSVVMPGAGIGACVAGSIEPSMRMALADASPRLPRDCDPKYADFGGSWSRRLTPNLLDRRPICGSAGSTIPRRGC